MSLLFQGCSEKEEQMLSNGNEVINSLHKLKAQKKFIEDLVQLYPGSTDEITRIKSEKIINNFLAKLIDASGSQISESEFWAILEVTARLSKTRAFGDIQFTSF